MIPPPLTDADVRQRLHDNPGVWVGELLGIYGESLDACSPEEIQAGEAVLNVYSLEWERAWRFGLAEDAQEQILRWLGAWENPEEKLRERYGHVRDLSPLWNALSEMCEVDDVYAWGITYRPWSQDAPAQKLILAPFIASVFCLVLAVVTGETWWAVAWISLVVLGMLLSLPGKPRRVLQIDQEIHPEITFREVAQMIQETARDRAEEMSSKVSQAPSVTS